jgi:hypothetical protein
MAWTAGDSSGSTTLTSNDGIYAVHINEIRTAIDNLGKSVQVTSTATFGTDPSTDGAIHLNNTANTGIGLSVYSNIGSSATAPLAYFKSGNSSFNRYTVEIQSTNANVTADTLHVQAAGARAIFIQQTGDAGSLIIDASQAPNTTTGSNQTVFSIQGNNSDFAMAKFVNQGQSSSNNANVFIQNSNAATTARTLQIDQHGSGSGIYIDQASGSNLAIEINTSKFGIKTLLTANGGYGLWIADDGTHTTGSTGLARISHLTTADTNPTLNIDNRSSGKSIYVQNNGTELFSVDSVGVLAIKDGLTAPSATSGLAKLYVDTADGDLKVIFGDGVIKTIVVDT